MILANVVFYNYQNWYLRYKTDKINKRVINEITKDVLSLNRIIYDEDVKDADDYSKHGFLVAIKKVV